MQSCIFPTCKLNCARSCGPRCLLRDLGALRPLLYGYSECPLTPLSSSVLHCVAGMVRLPILNSLSWICDGNNGASKQSVQLSLPAACIIGEHPVRGYSSGSLDFRRGTCSPAMCCPTANSWTSSSSFLLNLPTLDRVQLSRSHAVANPADSEPGGI